MALSSIHKSRSFFFLSSDDNRDQLSDGFLFFLAFASSKIQKCIFFMGLYAHFVRLHEKWITVSRLVDFVFELSFISFFVVIVNVLGVVLV